MQKGTRNFFVKYTVANNVILVQLTQPINKFVCLGLWHIILWRLFNAKSIFIQKNPVLFQKIQFGINTQFNCQKHFCFKLFSLVKQFKFKQFSWVYVYFFVYTQSNVKTVLFPTIQFCIQKQFYLKQFSLA